MSVWFVAFDSGEAQTKEQLWKEYFADPSQWWDNRVAKVSPEVIQLFDDRKLFMTNWDQGLGLYEGFSDSVIQHMYYWLPRMFCGEASFFANNCPLVVVG